jgi:predicted ATPase
MKITIENIGVFRFAEYELADLTIMCGRNNTGKTYATYSLYGFIDYFRQGYQIKVSQQHISTLIEDGSLILPIDASQETIDKYLEEACEKYKNFHVIG